MELKSLQRLSGEFFGTFMFVLTITLALALSPVAPFAIGFGLTVLVYMTGPVSGGQLNPAVTTGLMVRGALPVLDGIMCIIVQLLAALLAGVVGFLINGGVEWSKTGYPSIADTDRRGQAFFGEMIQTFALVTAVLGTATTKANDGKSFYGISIGFVVLSGALVLGGVTGGCFNPAVSMLTLLHGDWDDMPVYLFAPVIGGALAGLVFHITNPAEFALDNPILSALGLSNNPSTHESTRMISAFVMEFIGTFFLVWTVSLSVNAGSYGAIAAGCMLMSMVFTGGHVSGAHYNPAVTLGVFLRGMSESPPLINAYNGAIYMVIQVLAAFTAAGCATVLNDGADNIAAPGVGSGFTTFAAFIVELLYTMMLVTAVLSSATFPQVAGNSYFGMNIGWSVLVGALTVGAISGGVFNPSISIALPSVTGKHLEALPTYVIAEFLGSLLAVGQFMFWNKSVEPARAGSSAEVVNMPTEENPMESPVSQSDKLTTTENSSSV